MKWQTKQKDYKMAVNKYKSKAANEHMDILNSFKTDSEKRRYAKNAFLNAVKKNDMSTVMFFFLYAESINFLDKSLVNEAFEMVSHSDYKMKQMLAWKLHKEIISH